MYYTISTTPAAFVRQMGVLANHQAFVAKAFLKSFTGQEIDIHGRFGGIPAISQTLYEMPVLLKAWLDSGGHCTPEDFLFKTQKEAQASFKYHTGGVYKTNLKKRDFK